MPENTEVSPAKKDANDYSRFDFSDDDSEVEASIPTSDDSGSERDLSPQAFHENLAKSLSLKETGNSAFKSNNLEDAMKHYEEAIKLLKPFRRVSTPHPEIPLDKITEMKSVYVSVLSNSCMVSFKEEKWSQVISLSNEVLLEEADNVKALYRRSVAHHRTGYLEESKEGLAKVIELDASNAAAKKELIEVIKSIKEKKQKDRANLSGAFSSGSMYSDREAERQRKIRKAQEEEERLQDEWIKDKLKRRKEGDDDEISFDDWKKKRQKSVDDEKKRIEKEEKAKRKAANTTSTSGGISAKKKVAPVKKENEDDDDDVYDEEDNKIISETASKGYCYFKRQLPTEESRLIGDITPKAVTSELAQAPDSTSVPITTESTTTSGGVTASSWNHAGTWEERDLTQFATDRVKELCSAGRASLGGGAESGLEDALKSMDMSPNEDPVASIERMASAMATLHASVTEVKVKDGDAQIVMARGKKRHCFDFSLTIKFEVILQDLSGDESKNKKFKGTLEIHEFTPGLTAIDGRLTFKKDTSSRVYKCAEALKDDIFAKLRQFEVEYKAL